VIINVCGGSIFKGLRDDAPYRMSVLVCWAVCLSRLWMYIIVSYVELGGGSPGSLGVIGVPS